MSSNNFSLRRGTAYLINNHPYVFMGTLKHYRIFYGGKKGVLKVLLETDKINKLNLKYKPKGNN